MSDFQDRLENALINASIEHMENTKGTVITPKDDPEIQAWASHLAQSITQLFKDYIKDKKPEDMKSVRGNSQNTENPNYYTKKATGYNQAISEYYDNLKGGLE